MDSNDLDTTNVKKSLRRCLTYSQAFSMLVTYMVGSGLFISPPFVAALAPNMFIAIIVWILAGGCALLGSLCYCELASVVKKTGSSYIFVLDCYGKYPAFLVVWSNAVIVIPCATSIISYTAGMYICAPIIADQTSSSFVWYSKLFAVLIILLATFINCIGVKITGNIQTIVTTFCGCVIALTIGFGIYQVSITKKVPNLKPSVMFNNTLSGITHHFSAIGSAMFAALYCFDGWDSIAMFIEEIVEPARNIPLVALTSIPTVTVLFVVINIACLSVLSQREMAESVVVITTLAERVGSHAWAYVIPFFVGVTCFGTIISASYNFSRFLLSASREGQFLALFGLIHKSKRTPIPALLYIGITGSIIVICYGEHIQIAMRYMNIAIWAEYGIAISTLVVFRYKRPNVERFYKVFMTTPLFMIFVSASLIIVSFVEAPLNTSIAFAIILAGSLVYYMAIYKSWLSFLKSDALWRRISNSTNLVECQHDATICDRRNTELQEELVFLNPINAVDEESLNFM